VTIHRPRPRKWSHISDADTRNRRKRWCKLPYRLVTIKKIWAHKRLSQPTKLTHEFLSAKNWPVFPSLKFWDFWAPSKEVFISWDKLKMHRLCRVLYISYYLMRLSHVVRYYFAWNDNMRPFIPCIVSSSRVLQKLLLCSRTTTTHNFSAFSRCASLWYARK
jgi:hypothetical protein